MINSVNASLVSVQTEKTEPIQRTKELEEIKQAHKESKERQFTQIMSEVQASVDKLSKREDFKLEYQEFKTFLNDVGYEGKPIANLSQSEAAELVSEDGFFGVAQTSERIANFVISGAGGDEELLRAGKKGILQGFADAEKMWGGKLPDIAYETINKAVEMIDKALVENGFSVLDEKV